MVLTRPRMRAHYLQHVPFEGLGYIEPWLRDAGYEISCSALYRSTGFPDLGTVDLIIVLGGPMSVNDEGRYPWLIEEKRFIRNAIEDGKPVLGICLGAQLIAKSMGARVYRNHCKEIGWFPVHGVLRSGSPGIFSFPASIEVFHWHGETFDLPHDAILLARNEACQNQAFQIGRKVIGLQFHLEMTPESAQNLVSNCREELLPAKYVQSEAAIMEVAPEKFRENNREMDRILTFLTKSNHGSLD